MKLLELKGIHFSHFPGHAWILDKVNLVLRRGECHCISGPTGSGKSSLLNLMAGEQSRPFEGELVRHQGLMTGLVMQDPNVQVLRQTVGAEIAFSLENLGVPSSQMLDKVQAVLRRVGLYVSLNTRLDVLSLGQKYRLMIAAQLVFEPHILLLDEPWAQLDDVGVNELICVLRQLLGDGVCVVMVEHNPRAFCTLIDRLWQLEDGELRAGLYGQQDPRLSPAPKAAADSECRVSAEAFEFKFIGQPSLFRCEQGLHLYGGEIVALIGENGSGKSSLLKSLAGIQSGIGPLPIRVLGRQPKLGIFGSDIGLLMQRPNRQLFEQSVLAEMEFSLRRFNLPLGRGMQMLERLELAHLADSSPHKLSYGQQHLVALASLACLAPKVLLLDDPLAGLDRRHSNKVWQLLLDLCGQGCAILLTSHRPLAQASVSRCWHLHRGRLSEGIEPVEISNVG